MNDDTSDAESEQARLRNDLRLVQRVRGRAYFCYPPKLTAIASVIAACLAAILTDDSRHLFAIAYALLAVMSANARISPINGWPVWLAIGVTLIFAKRYPEPCFVLAGWGAVTWLIGSIETRVTKEPWVPPDQRDPQV